MLSVAIGHPTSYVSLTVQRLASLACPLQYCASVHIRSEMRAFCLHLCLGPSMCWCTEPHKGWGNAKSTSGFPSRQKDSWCTVWKLPTLVIMHSMFCAVLMGCVWGRTVAISFSLLPLMIPVSPSFPRPKKDEGCRPNLVPRFPTVSSPGFWSFRRTGQSREPSFLLLPPLPWESGQAGWLVWGLMSMAEGSEQSFHSPAFSYHRSNTDLSCIIMVLPWLVGFGCGKGVKQHGEGRSLLMKFMEQNEMRTTVNNFGVFFQ